MYTKDENTVLRKAVQIVVWILSTIMLSVIFLATASASTDTIKVQGKVYEFDKNNHYEFSDENQFVETSEDNTYGVFFCKWKYI